MRGTFIKTHEWHLRIDLVIIRLGEKFLYTSCDDNLLAVDLRKNFIQEIVIGLITSPPDRNEVIAPAWKTARNAI